MKHIYLSFSLAFLFFYSHAQWTADTTMNTVVHDTLGATAPLIASTIDGATYISWFEFGGSNYDLHMQLLDSNGYKLWAPEGIIVSNLPQNSAIYRYDLKTDIEGNAIVAFQDERSGTLNAVVYKIDRNGNSIWANGLLLLDSLSTDGLSPTIGVSGNNEVFVAWHSENTGIRWISMQRISANGSLLWITPYRMIDSSMTTRFERAELFPSGSDDIQMLYVGVTGSFPGTSTMYTQRIHPAGNNFWTVPIQVSTKTIPVFIFPQPVPDDNGGFYVAFNSSNPVSTSLNDVYVQYVDYNGNLWSSTGTEAANSTSEHKLAASSHYITSMSEFWVLLQVLDGAQGSSGVSVQKFDALGSVLLGANALEILPVDPIYYNPNTINDAGDGMVMTLTAGGFNQEHISAVKIDYNGGLLWTPSRIPMCAVNSNKDDVQSDKFFNDNLVLVWQDDRNGSGIFAQNISRAGGTGILTNVTPIKNELNIRILSINNYPEIIFEKNNVSWDLKVLDDKGSSILHSMVNPGLNHIALKDLENMSDGLYLITLSNSSASKTFKWIKNN